mmetsp:Transcript_39529/g.80874  ORF Transcript_39529/g.80874 Transcript_39529/m.80874 type:complete len:219 (+) Transcript_39529:381-1037(+)
MHQRVPRGLGAQLRDAASVELQKRRKAQFVATKSCELQFMWSDSGTFGHEPSDHWTLVGECCIDEHRPTKGSLEVHVRAVAQKQFCRFDAATFSREHERGDADVVLLVGSRRQLPQQALQLLRISKFSGRCNGSLYSFGKLPAKGLQKLFVNGSDCLEESRGCVPLRLRQLIRMVLECQAQVSLPKLAQAVAGKERRKQRPRILQSGQSCAARCFHMT